MQVAHTALTHRSAKSAPGCPLPPQPQPPRSAPSSARQTPTAHAVDYSRIEQLATPRHRSQVPLLRVCHACACALRTIQREWVSQGSEMPLCAAAAVRDRARDGVEGVAMPPRLRARTLHTSPRSTSTSWREGERGRSRARCALKRGASACCNTNTHTQDMRTPIRPFRCTGGWSGRVAATKRASVRSGMMAEAVSNATGAASAMGWAADDACEWLFAASSGNGFHMVTAAVPRAVCTPSHVVVRVH